MGQQVWSCQHSAGEGSAFLHGLPLALVTSPVGIDRSPGLGFSGQVEDLFGAAVSFGRRKYISTVSRLL